LSEDVKKAGSRVKTGIPGLDDLIEGGFLPRSTILLRGGSGAGKTLFALQFLHYGALNGQPGVLLSLEEAASDLRREAARFGWELEELERRGTFRIVELRPWTEAFKYDLAIQRLEDVAKEIGARRVAIDSVQTLFQSDLNEAVVNKAIGHLSWKLGQSLRVTSLLIAKTNGNPTVEEDICRGVIELRLKLVQGVVKRYLLVKKMRETQHSNRLYVYDFTPRGLAVFNPTSAWTSPPQGHAALEAAEEFL